MGITYNEDKYVYAVMVVPDGRIISHRAEFKFGGSTDWCSTVCRRIVDVSATRAIDSFMWGIFELDTPTVKGGLTKLLNFYTDRLNKTFEIYRLDLKSGVPLICPNRNEVKLLPFPTIINTIRNNKHHGFTLETERVMIALQDSKKLE